MPVANPGAPSNAHAAGSSATPWTVSMNVNLVNAGAEQLSYQMVHARRSDGAVANLSLADAKARPGEFRQIQFTDGRNVTLYDRQHIKVQHIPAVPIDPETQAEMSAARNGPCELVIPGAIKVADDALLGFKATVVDMDNQENTVRIRAWLAPQLGCTMLQYTTQRLIAGTWTTIVAARPTSVRVGEPDARLFDLGNQYEVVSLEEAKRRTGPVTP